MGIYVSYFLIITILSVITYFVVRYLRYRNLDYKKFIQHNPISPDNTTIAFDLHDVIVNYDYKQIAKHILKAENKFSLFIHILNPFFWWDLIKLFANNCVAEQYLLTIGNKYKKLQPHIPLGIKIANSQKPQPKMVRLLIDLAKQGYELHLFSNIGAKIFQDLKQKMPGLFDYFDGFTIPSPKNGYTRKPNQNAFDNFLSKHKHIKKQIIFIDDKKKNIKKGQKNGIIAIRFRNPDQIIRELKDIGVLS